MHPLCHYSELLCWNFACRRTWRPNRDWPKLSIAVAADFVTAVAAGLAAVAVALVAVCVVGSAADSAAVLEVVYTVVFEAAAVLHVLGSAWQNRYC